MVHFLTFRFFSHYRSDGATPTPRRNIRGDIHSGAPPSTPSYSRGGRRANAEEGLGFPTSSAASGGPRSGGGAGDPSSSAPGGAETIDGDDEDDDNGPVTVIWGTTVTLQASMAAFRWFLEDFRAGDRQIYDNRRYEEALEEGKGNEESIEFAHGKERPEKRMYQHYLERMRETGQTNLNLDISDLLAFRAGQRSQRDLKYHQLAHNLLLYPQEIIPILDQVLKDCAIDWAENNLGGEASKADNIARAEAMLGSSFKVRPFGGEKRTDMRQLNPQGLSCLSDLHTL